MRRIYHVVVTSQNASWFIKTRNKMEHMTFLILTVEIGKHKKKISIYIHHQNLFVCLFFKSPFTWKGTSPLTFLLPPHLPSLLFFFMKLWMWIKLLCCNFWLSIHVLFWFHYNYTLHMYAYKASCPFERKANCITMYSQILRGIFIMP